LGSASLGGTDEAQGRAMRDDTYWEAEKMTRMVVSGVGADITMTVVFGAGNVVRLSREQLRHLIFSLERRLATRSDDDARPEPRAR
jgi:hypothetical protein